jgi:hypothetical protein
MAKSQDTISQKNRKQIERILRKYYRPTAQGVIAMASIVINVVVFTAIIKRAIEQHKNPYTNEIWTGTKDFELAMARKED